MNNILVILLPLLFLSTITKAEVIHSERSLYTNILVDEKDNSRCLKFSLRRELSSQSCINIKEPQKLVFSYYKLLFSSLLVLDNPENILIIGLGGGIMSNTIHQIYPNAQITNVEIDPAVIKVAEDFFNFKTNNKVAAVEQDGRIFVKRAKLKNQRYDWIILDAFNGDYIPEHLMTAEFLQDVKALLSERGVVAANTFSSSKLYKYESATYAHVFGPFYNVRFNYHGNRIILSKPKNNAGLVSLREKAKSLEQQLALYNIDIFAVLNAMETTQDWPTEHDILTDQYSPANLLK